MEIGRIALPIRLSKRRATVVDDSVDLCTVVITMLIMLSLRLIQECAVSSGSLFCSPAAGVAAALLLRRAVQEPGR